MVEDIAGRLRITEKRRDTWTVRTGTGEESLRDGICHKILSFGEKIKIGEVALTLT